jgi:hypothetical protein
MGEDCETTEHDLLSWTMELVRLYPIYIYIYDYMEVSINGGTQKIDGLIWGYPHFR